MKIKQIILIMALCLSPLAAAFSQEKLTVETAQVLARENYPLIARYGLIAATTGYDIANANKGYFPELSLSAKATYQSAVTSFPLSIPGIEVPALPKDQYQAAVELDQIIWDGGVISSNKKIIRAASDADNQSLEVDLYQINERVNEMFFGILLIEAQLGQNIMLQRELKANHERVAAYLAGGVATQSDLDVVRAQMVDTHQREIEFTSMLGAYQQMLSAFIGKDMNAMGLERPDVSSAMPDTEINRPELTLFDKQDQVLALRSKMVMAKNLPKFSFYVQGGIGRPGLNFLSPDFDPFYIGGVRLAWNFGGLYTQKDERRVIETNRMDLQVQRETFLFNTNLQVTRQVSEVDKVRDLMKSDDEIIALRKSIKEATQAKVLNGTRTVTDMVEDIVAEDLARQGRNLHEIQLIKAVYDLKQTTNDYQ